MKYSYEEGNFKKGDILSIKIDRKANIYLMDRENFSRYKSALNFQYYGGTTNNASPYNINVPQTGYWYVVIDLDGGTGILNYSIKVFR